MPFRCGRGGISQGKAGLDQPTFGAGPWASFLSGRSGTKAQTKYQQLVSFDFALWRASKQWNKFGLKQGCPGVNVSSRQIWRELTPSPHWGPGELFGR